MGRKCTICTHPEYEQIDKAILKGEANRQIAARFGVSESSVRRHRKNGHIVEVLAKAQDAAEVAYADDLLARAKAYEEEAHLMLARAKEIRGNKDAVDASVKAIREARSCLELLAKLRGELEAGTKINVLILPEWTRLKMAILEALRPYPEAREAVRRALLALGSGE